MEEQGWAVGVGEDVNVGIHVDVTGSRSGSGRLDFGWNVNRDKRGDSDEESKGCWSYELS